MNAFKRFLRGIGDAVPTDSAFENYYGRLVRTQAEGSPSAAEARRDFNAVRQSINFTRQF